MNIINWKKKYLQDCSMDGQSIWLCSKEKRGVQIERGECFVIFTWWGWENDSQANQSGILTHCCLAPIDMHWTATWSYIITTTLVHFDEDRNHFTSRSQALLALTSRSMGKLIPKLSASVNNSLEYMWLKKSATIQEFKRNYLQFLL